MSFSFKGNAPLIWNKVQNIYFWASSKRLESSQQALFTKYPSFSLISSSAITLSQLHQRIKVMLLFNADGQTLFRRPFSDKDLNLRSRVLPPVISLSPRILSKGKERGNGRRGKQLPEKLDLTMKVERSYRYRKLG